MTKLLGASEPVPIASYSPFEPRDPLNGITAHDLAQDILELSGLQLPKSPISSGASAFGFRLESLADMLARPDIPTDYLVDGLLVRGTVSMLVAKPKVGKSTLARSISFAVARGASFLGRRTSQGKCFYFALEEREQELRADFRAMGAGATEPIYIHADSAPEGGLTALVDIVRSHRPALVIIDPLFRIIRVHDEKAYGEIYTALGPMIDAARDSGTHILIVHHSGKMTKGDAIDSPLGSTALSGAVSTLIVLTRLDRYRSIKTVQRIGTDMPETILSFDAATREFSLTGSRADADRDALAREIVDYMKSSGIEKTEPEICDAVEGTNAVKRKALRSLVERAQLQRHGSGKRGDPFKYSYPRTDPLQNVTVQETQNTRGEPEHRY
jgi:hypothetical protein